MQVTTGGPAPTTSTLGVTPETVVGMTRYVFVTGGVVSSLGKGIAAASLAAVLEARGLKVTLLKLDPVSYTHLRAHET